MRVPGQQAARLPHRGPRRQSKPGTNFEGYCGQALARFPPPNPSSRTCIARDETPHDPCGPTQVHTRHAIGSWGTCPHRVQASLRIACHKHRCVQHRTQLIHPGFIPKQRMLNFVRTNTELNHTPSVSEAPSISTPPTPHPFPPLPVLPVLPAAKPSNAHLMRCHFPIDRT